MTDGLSANLQHLETSATIAISAEAKRRKAAGEDVIDLGAGEPDFPTPPIPAEAGIRAIKDGKTHYSANEGILELRAAAATHLSLLSSVGANAASRNPYIRVKGTAEQRVSSAGIPRVSLFRPSLLVTREIRYGLQDRVTQALFPFLQPLLPKRYHAVRVEDLARAMRINAERPGSPGIEILEYPAFVSLLT